MNAYISQGGFGVGRGFPVIHGDMNSLPQLGPDDNFIPSVQPHPFNSARAPVLGFGRGRGFYNSGAVSFQAPGQSFQSNPNRTPPALNDLQTFDGAFEDPDDCVFCNRPACIVICQACGFTYNGRVRKKCASHPGFIHLMDPDVCTSCLKPQLKECREGSMPGAKKHTPTSSQSISQTASPSNLWLN